MAKRLVAVALLLLIPSSAGASHSLGFHWRKRTSLATVTLVDDTHGRFPVAAAVANWNHAARIRWSLASQCAPPRPCVHVMLRDMDYLGITYMQADADDHFTSVSVYLSATRAMSGSKRLSVTCHELGHALGLGHQPDGAGSCMVNNTAYPPEPNGHDYAELDAIYAHRH